MRKEVNSMSSIICYTDTSTNETHYARIDDVNVWKENHITKSYRIDYVFLEKWSIKDTDINLEHAFLNHCSNYGLTNNDLHALFVNKKGQTVELLGFNPKNKKYKFIILNHSDNKRYKVSSNAVLSYQRLND